MRKVYSENKKKLIEEANNSELVIGEFIQLTPECVEKNPYMGLSNNCKFKITNINGDEITIKPERSDPVVINKTDIKSRDMLDIGADPFDKKYKPIETSAYVLESIIFQLNLVNDKRENYVMDGIEVNEVNWNPFVYDTEGNKQYYQREFCWTLEQEQLLIDSIYKGIGCGTVIIRERSWETLEAMSKNGETELYFFDIVDGKQRMNTIKRFINNKFKDSYGNYFSDLSDRAQINFVGHQLFSYAKMSPNTTDDEVLFQFLKLNHAGVPQSPEHINYVTNLLKLV